MHVFLILLFALFGSVLWRLRGGAFTTLTGLNFGTDPDRAVTCILLSLPLAMINPVGGCAVMVGLFVGLLISGWGSFDGAGVEQGMPIEKTWMNWLPTKLGLTEQTFWFDMVGLAEAAFVFVLPTIVGLFIAGLGLKSLGMLAMVPLFPLAYAIPRKISLPTIPNFATGQEWGENFVGAFLAIVLGLIF